MAAAAGAAGGGVAETAAILVEMKNAEVNGYHNLANNKEFFNNNNYKSRFNNVLDNQLLKDNYNDMYFNAVFEAINELDNDELGNALEHPKLTDRSTNKRLISNLIHTGNDISMLHAKTDNISEAVDDKQLLVHSTKDRIGHWTACLLATICNKHIGQTFLAK
jgi:hypothetical protein